MSVYVDKAQNPYGRMKMCHMVADTLDELHAMAEKIGMKRTWFQDHPDHPHYDLSQSKRELAIQNGAIELERYQLVMWLQTKRKEKLKMKKEWEVKQHLEAAHKMVSALCHGERRWIMSVPAQPDYDPDLVIGQALGDADKILQLLVESNELLRSAHSIAERAGKDTNWDGFEKQLKNILEKQHEFLSGYYLDRMNEQLTKVEPD